MSLLPQRKKSAEEIAKLRESLGIPGQSSEGEEIPALPEPASAIVEKAVAQIPEENMIAPVAPEPELMESQPGPLAPLPVHAAHPPRPVRSLKRSERIPVLPVAEIQSDELEPEAQPSPTKTVRSLRKSELVPITPAEIHTPPPGSKLPVHRHNDRELNEIRRQSAINAQAVSEHFTKMAAHPVTLVPGYVAAFGGAASFWYYEFPIGVTAGCVIVALILAAFVFLNKPLSRHHAAFISVIALFVIVFGALHYFPQLRHGT